MLLLLCDFEYAKGLISTGESYICYLGIFINVQF